MARHDPLTDLANRALFRERLNDGLACAAREGNEMAMLCLDLDYFKAVNDTHGHPIGDALLIMVAERLRSSARETGTVARLGGDEFAVLMPGATPKLASSLARRIVSRLGEPYDVDGHPVDIGVSVGVAMAPSDGGSSDQILRSSDMALYRAKAEGRGTYCFFEPGMDASMQMRRPLRANDDETSTTREFTLEGAGNVSTW
ncbi:MULTISPECIES: GGDEF domain-containing protein [unclassified Aurantimonas]|uniref:GGDEF domain-containing protein n=1 Tax=Aurantimonas sp. C2-6-R+9 TaxID=3114365 RepID=UPI002E17426C